MTHVEREARRILELAGSPFAALQVVERQLGVLVLRTQVMLSLAGIVITVTGFSGRAIVATSRLAQLSVAAGIVLVLAAAGVAIVGVLRLSWITELIEDDPLRTLVRAIEVRQAKSRYLGVALGLFSVGFAGYVLAIVQLLLAG